MKAIGLGPPKVQAPTMRMPDLDAPSARLAARRKAEERKKKGREGTIDGAYTNTNLGGSA
ncbi:MAG: hypothetical protein ACRDHG_09235 [Anaerolineales bacterium]